MCIWRLPQCCILGVLSFWLSFCLVVSGFLIAKLMVSDFWLRSRSTGSLKRPEKDGMSRRSFPAFSPVLVLILALVWLSLYHVVESALPLSEIQAMDDLRTYWPVLRTNTTWNWTGDANVSSCTWRGVTCRSNHIAELNLMPAWHGFPFPASQLNGTIPIQTLLSFTALQAIYFATNRLEGTIPAQLSNFTQLSVIDLSSNSLNGTIPPELSLLPLASFSLGHNQLTGSIPSSLARCANMWSLYVPDHSPARLSSSGFSDILPPHSSSL